MPVSELAYYDVGLDYFCQEVLETSADSQRVIYEDPAVELQEKLARDAISQEISSKEVGKGQGNTTQLFNCKIPAHKFSSEHGNNSKILWAGRRHNENNLQTGCKGSI